MAEYASHAGEKSVKDYDYMRKIKLFEEDEIRRIIKVREQLQYKISRPNRCLGDFCELIKYENTLFKLVLKREDRSKSFSKLRSSMIERIKNLYNLALCYYPERIEFWTKCIEFLEKNGYCHEVSGFYMKMLQHHGDEPYVWIDAALFEYGNSQDIGSVKSIFFRALQRHPLDLNIHLEFLKAMLNEAKKMSPELTLQNNTQSEQQIGLERVELIYMNSAKKITDVEYYIEALDTAESYPFTRSLQVKMIYDMMHKFPLNEKIWHIFAQRELKGFSLDDYCNFEEDDVNKMITEHCKYDASKRPTLKRKIQLCVDIYTNAVKELATEEMWSYYINAMLALQVDRSTLKNFKREKLGLALKEAHEANFISEHLYGIYIDMLKENENNNSEYLIEVMNTSVERYPKSIKLWEKIIIYHFSKDDIIAVEETFKKAKEKLGSSSALIYKIIIQYYQARQDFKKVDEIYNEACRETAKEFLNFRVDFLEYTALIKENIDITRKLYDELTLLPPAVLSLHDAMAFIESIIVRPDENRWRQCYENATNLLGKTDASIWFRYLKFERDYGDPKNFTLLFERARKTLDEDLLSGFVTDYQLFIAGLS